MGKNSKKNKKSTGKNHQQERKQEHKAEKRDKHSKKENKKYAKVDSVDAIQLAKKNSLAKSDKSFTVGLLEEAMLREFPSEQACAWDKTGLLVGERGLPVTRVAVALDVTVTAIEKAAANGANVLITHHPAYMNPPDSFYPEHSVMQNPGALVWAAIKNRVALMNFHTALDVSPAAQVVLPSMLGLDYTGKLLEPTSDNGKLGFGQICSAGKEGMLLSHLAARAMSVFGRLPRVWGNMENKVKNIVTATGSANGQGKLCLQHQIDCLVCGEIKYHEALSLSEAGICIIELGHDVSELPLVAVLAETLAKIGLHRDDIVIIDQSNNWKTPEAIRM